MGKLPDDELLSAYLDGEVSGAQRAEVEALLAGDPSARQTFEELRAVRGAIQGLPQLELGEDLTARVLQLAEMRLLAEGPTSDDAPAPRAAHWSAPLRGFLGRRAVVWSGLAVAIALMILLTERERPANQINPQPGAGLQAGREPIGPIGPQSEPPTLRPMPGAIAKQLPPAGRAGGIQAAARGTVAGAQEQPILLVKCFVRADPAQPDVLNALLARQRIVRDDTPRLIQRAREQLGTRIQQSPPAGWVAAGEPSLIYAEVNPGQIDGLLQAMGAQRDDFPQVAVEPGEKAAAGQKQPVLLVVQPVRPAK